MSKTVPDHLRQRAPGAGRKPAGYAPPAGRSEYEAARARNEAAKAGLNELELKIKAGDHVARADVRQATATALSTLAQTLRSVPDNLERKRGISPQIAAEVGEAIDDALADVANAFEALHHAHADAGVAD